MHQYKEANALIWGAWGGLVCALVALAAQMANEPIPQTVWGAGMGGFFWVWCVANARNSIAGWMDKRLR